MTLVILARQIDISIGSQLSICGVGRGITREGWVADAGSVSCGDGNRRIAGAR